MHIIIMIGCLILWAVVQRHLTDIGHQPLSRGQLRYMRRKARRLGVPVEQVPYRPRRGTNPFSAPYIPTDSLPEPHQRPLELHQSTGKEPSDTPKDQPEESRPWLQKRSEWPQEIPPGWRPPAGE